MSGGLENPDDGVRFVEAAGGGRCSPSGGATGPTDEADELIDVDV